MIFQQISGNVNNLPNSYGGDTNQGGEPSYPAMHTAWCRLILHIHYPASKKEAPFRKPLFIVEVHVAMIRVAMVRVAMVRVPTNHKQTITLS
jgi:hypothetical protein